MTPKAFLAWMAAMTVVLAIGLWAVLARVGPIAFSVGFLPSFVVLLALSWTGRLDRLLPAAAATLLVGLWPLYRWLAHGDVTTAKAFLFLAGFINVLLVVFTALEFAKRRGWFVDSPVRRRLGNGLMLVYFASSVIGWPTGIWRTGLLVAWSAVLLSGFFWPARTRAVTSAPVSS